MSNDLSQNTRAAVRAALGHLESRAPAPPPMPNPTQIPLRPRRLWSPSVVVAAAFIAALLTAVPVILWLRSTDDAAGPDTPTTSQDTSTPETAESTSTTTPTTTTTTTSDPTTAAFLSVLDEFDAQATTFLDRTNQIEAGWQNRQTSYPDTQSALLSLQADIDTWATMVAGVLDVPPSLESAYALLVGEVLVGEVGDLPSAAEAIRLGLNAPDDGTQRRAAVAAFVQEIQEVHGAIEDLRTITTTDDIPLSVFGLDAQDLEPQRMDHPDVSQLPSRARGVANLLAAEFGPPVWYGHSAVPIFSGTYDLGFDYGPDRSLVVGWIEDSDPSLFHDRLTPGYTLHFVDGVEIAVVRDFDGVQINLHPGDVWVRMSVDVASLPLSSRIEAAEADQIEEWLIAQVPRLLTALGLQDA